MDFNAIKDMIKTMDDSKLGYLEVNWHGISIVMKKEGEPDFSKQLKTNSNLEIEESKNPTQEVIEEKIDVKSETTKESLAVSTAEQAKEDVKTVSYDENIKEVVSPIVGTFYASSGPDKPAYAKVGSKVKKGDTLCIIEAMKLMNEIQSEVDGEIVEALIQNEQMVEYGQLMFRIRV